MGPAGQALIALTAAGSAGEQPLAAISTDKQILR